ncbi:MAG: Bug family tripartite tricarboxylate transporter substrate binding protein [Bacillaceae bacterium]
MQLKKRTLSLIALSSLAISLTACGSPAKESSKGSDSKYEPKKAITVVAPSGAGGGWDLTARSFTKLLSTTKLVDETLTVENKPGGGGAVFMAEYATQDVKDNEKLFVNSPPILINNLKKEGNSPFGYKNTTPLAQLTKDYGAIVVKADSPYKDLKSLLDKIKTDPSKVVLAGGSAPGSMDHLIGVLPAYKYGIDPTKIKYVSYDGGGEAITALLGGNADVIATDVSSVREFLKSGRVKILATTSPEKLQNELSDIPTLKDAGIDAEFIIWRGVFGPKEMSPEAYKYWENTISQLVEKEEWTQELQAQGWDADYKNGDDFKKFLQEQEVTLQELLKSLGMAK